MNNGLSDEDYFALRKIATSVYRAREFDETQLVAIISRLVKPEAVTIALERMKEACVDSDHMRVVIGAIYSAEKTHRRKGDMLSDVDHLRLCQISRLIYEYQDYDAELLRKIVVNTVGDQHTDEVVEKLVSCMRIGGGISALMPIFRQAKANK